MESGGLPRCCGKLKSGRARVKSTATERLFWRRRVTLGAASIRAVSTARSYLIEGDIDEATVTRQAARFLTDPVVETSRSHLLPEAGSADTSSRLLNVLFHAGVTDNVGRTACDALRERGLEVQRVATCRKYWVNGDADEADVARLCARVLANEAIEHVVRGPLQLESLSLGSDYGFELLRVPLREMDDADLERQSREGQLYLSLVEMQTIQRYFRDLDRDPTDIELETVAQTWSEHCSHKTLAGRIRYRDEQGERQFENMLKETVFAATQEIRARLGEDDWCVSVFKDNAGVVTFNETYDVCFKVETHNHPSALEPYGGANTGIGGVIRDPMGTGMGAKPFCNTDVFCFRIARHAARWIAAGRAASKIRNAGRGGRCAGLREQDGNSHGQRSGLFR